MSHAATVNYVSHFILIWQPPHYKIRKKIHFWHCEKNTKVIRHIIVKKNLKGFASMGLVDEFDTECHSDDGHESLDYGWSAVAEVGFTVAELACDLSQSMVNTLFIHLGGYSGVGVTCHTLS
ncbi:unnamed protein product, partial [Meganyctiphanes norvegica]